MSIITSDALADLVVTQLNAASSPPIAFTAEKPGSVADAQVEQEEFRVFVLPYSEAETPFDQGNTCRRELVVSLVVNGPIAGQINKRLSLEFALWVRTTLENSELGGYTWGGNETVSLYDVDALKTKNQFLSLARAAYFDFS
jgi:hypothetical protein